MPELPTAITEAMPELALGWHRSGKGAVLATVIETWGSAPRRTGSQLVIEDLLMNPTRARLLDILILMGIGISVLELFVAILQAFIFTLLSSVFIGLIREGAH